MEEGRRSEMKQAGESGDDEAMVTSEREGERGESVRLKLTRRERRRITRESNQICASKEDKLRVQVANSRDHCRISTVVLHIRSAKMMNITIKSIYWRTSRIQ